MSTSTVEPCRREGIDAGPDYCEPCSDYLQQWVPWEGHDRPVERTIGEGEFCYSHGRREPIPDDGGYVRCFECGHVFATRDELIDAHQTKAGLTNDELTPQMLKHLEGFCGHCVHDFWPCADGPCCAGIRAAFTANASATSEET